MEYSADDYGMGYLSAEDSKPFFVVLSGEFIKITGEAFALPETIEILEGMENRLFEKYASEHPRREQALSAWVYLEKIYRLYKSGLLKDVIDSHFWLIENSGRSLDSVYVEMEISIDFMIENLASDENKLNEITDHLFQLLERRSLFKASEYLAIKALTQNACTLNNELAMQLEAYRAMKVGNTAPDIEFTGDVLKSGTAINEPEYLSELKSDYYVVIFGASWCPACPEDLRQIALLYPKWKENGVEVVFISLDTDKNTFFKFTKYFPFISMCDYQKWDTRSARDYYVFTTPLMYLLDANREILLRPNSVRHMDSWVDWFLVQDTK